MTGKIILISVAAALSSSPLPEQCTWHGSDGKRDAGPWIRYALIEHRNMAENGLVWSTGCEYRQSPDAGSPAGKKWRDLSTCWFISNDSLYYAGEYGKEPGYIPTRTDSVSHTDTLSPSDGIFAGDISGIITAGRGKMLRAPHMSLHLDYEEEMDLHITNGIVTDRRYYSNTIREGLSLRAMYEWLEERFPYERFPGIRNPETLLSFRISDMKLDRKGKILSCQAEARTREGACIDTAAVETVFMDLLKKMPPLTVCNIRGENVWEYDTVHIPMPERYYGQLYSEAMEALLIDYPDYPVARFQAGSCNDFQEWVDRNKIYPEEALSKGIQGRVILQFTINGKGQMENVKILRKCHPLLDAEAVRVVSSSPDWTPSRDLAGDGRSSTYTMSVSFRTE